MGKKDNLSDRYRITDGRKLRWKDFDPRDTGGLDGKKGAEDLLARGTARLSELQDKLFAQDRWSVLVILQALDAAGKDGTVKHVMSGVNPQGCHIVSFKAPSEEELAHNWMWRCFSKLPPRGSIGIFNRSYYEEVLVVRVHPEILAKQKIPPELVTKDVWKQRFEDIAAFERFLARNGCRILKFFLNVSKAEQKKRFLERLDEPEKNWKFRPQDMLERQSWDEYQRAYEEAIAATSAEHAPWYVVPADKKWFTRLVVAEAIVAELEKLDLAYPKIPAEEKKALAEQRAKLERED